MSETNIQKLFRVAKILAPESMEASPYQAEDRVHRNPYREITREEHLKRIRGFIEKYGAGYGPPKLPLRMRLVYDLFSQRIFEATDARQFFFNLLDCCQQLLDEYEITQEPRSVMLEVYRHWQELLGRTYANPTRPRIHGKWISIMALTITEQMPFVNFEEIELAHEELWLWCQEYARRQTSPCGEIPLVEQNCGTFMPMQ
jgi:hypothetical protein